MIKRYKTKPCEIEAIKFTAENINEILKWMGNSIVTLNFESSHDFNMIIHTLEGDMMAEADKDYIIKGLLGEFYPCKAEAFENKYEPVEE